MRIAIVHSFYSSGSPSGENRVVQLQTEALRRAGHEVALVSAHTDELEASRAYRVASAMRVATGHGNSPLRLIEKFAPDVVHVHNLFPNYGSAWLANVSAPIVATLHNFRSFCSNGMLARDGHNCLECPLRGSHRSLVHRCYRGSAVATVPLAIQTRGAGKRNRVLVNADALVSLAPRSRDTFASFAPQTTGRLHVVPNFTPNPGDPLAVNAEHPWVFIGRLSEEKGILNLVRAWPSDQPLTVVGSGPLADQVEAASRGKLIRLTGQLPPDEVQSVLAASKALVFPSTWREGAPAMTYVEALAAGRPTVALSGNAVADDLDVGRAGLVISSLDEISHALEELNTNLQAFSARARVRFEEEFSESVWLSRIEDIYRCVL